MPDAGNQSDVGIIGNALLKIFAPELPQGLKANFSIDRANRDSARGHIGGVLAQTEAILPELAG